jgi:hypothetical protein
LVADYGPAPHPDPLPAKAGRGSRAARHSNLLPVCDRGRRRVSGPEASGASEARPRGRPIRLLSAAGDRASKRRNSRRSGVFSTLVFLIIGIYAIMPSKNDKATERAQLNEADMDRMVPRRWVWPGLAGFGSIWIRLGFSLNIYVTHRRHGPHSETPRFARLLEA